MKVSKEEWQDKLNNLNVRRATEVIKNDFAAVDNYCSHVNKCHIGKTVLDVGCGLQLIRSCVPDRTLYFGLDPTVMVTTSMPLSIEDSGLQDNSFDTIYCFATLDGVQDLKLAVDEMKRIAAVNIVILTGIDIEPDKYHTHKITEPLLESLFKDWELGTYDWITNKVLLIEYFKP